MAWFKVDDGFYTSSKVLSIPRTHRLAAVGLWTMAGNWCARELSDGRVPEYVLAELGATPRLRRALVEARLWLDQGPAGVEFKNWDEYQPTRAEVEAERAKTAERQRRWRERQKGETGDSHVSNAVTNTVTNTVSNGAPTRPDPTRPDKKTSSSSRRKPEHPIPADWSPNDNHREQARAQQVDVEREASAFRDHAAANDRRLRDWDAGFRMWLTKARPAFGGNRPQQPRRSSDDWMQGT